MNNQKMRILEKKTAVIFDLDGTLVDSMWMWKAIDIEYLARFGCECPPDLQRIIEGMSLTETAVYFKKRFCINDSLEKIKADWIEMSIDKYRNEVSLKEGVKPFLDSIKELGIPMGIATSSGRELVDAALKSLMIDSYFSNITTACQVAAGKPAPDIYLKVAEHLQAKPEDCLVFEDVPAGILAAKAAGMTVVAVDDVFSRNRREEKEALADYFIESYREFFQEEREIGKKR